MDNLYGQNKALEDSLKPSAFQVACRYNEPQPLPSDWSEFIIDQIEVEKALLKNEIPFPPNNDAVEIQIGQLLRGKGCQLVFGPHGHFNKVILQEPWYAYYDMEKNFAVIQQLINPPHERKL